MAGFHVALSGEDLILAKIKFNATKGSISRKGGTLYFLVDFAPVFKSVFDKAGSIQIEFSTLFAKITNP